MVSGAGVTVGGTSCSELLAGIEASKISVKGSFVQYKCGRIGLVPFLFALL